jgi:uncharacterized DUF497 family protein
MESMNYKEFDWDEDKYNENLKKHKITFEEASTVFEDADALILYDDIHSDNEDRFVIIGFSEQERMLFVSHCYRNENVIRIISARKATRAEHKKYHAQF